MPYRLSRVRMKLRQEVGSDEKDFNQAVLGQVEKTMASSHQDSSRSMVMFATAIVKTLQNLVHTFLP